ncbi:uncharacterized protein LOC124149877 [Haliotis rufescens]|uniref:uncharacterized protein LOC124149877 n=1 Tax=Haliotis rufescens TaxID=6454 RepID=UPI00201ED5FC|nr:uncharacterized protein LOC124149877 [Haliotis rufescens]
MGFSVYALMFFCMVLCHDAQGAKGRLVYFKASLSKIKTYGIHSTVIFDKCEANIGKGYNPTSGVFHAPVSGYYEFKVQLEAGSSGGYSFCLVCEGVVKSELSIQRVWSSKFTSAIFHVNAGEHVLVRKTVHGGATRIAAGARTQFSGYLLRSD